MSMTGDASDDQSINAPIQPKRWGRKVDSAFTNPPQDELWHLCINWLVEKLSMEQYMHDYAKQEGFAVNALKERGGVIRWHCYHAGKYDGHCNLPADVTNKTQRGKLAESGDFPFRSSVIVGQPGWRRHGASSKQGWQFYVVFIDIGSCSLRYRCDGIRAEHKCEKDPNTWDRYSYYGTQNPLVRNEAMNHGVTAASVSNPKYSVWIQPADIPRIVHSNNERTRSLSDAGLSISNSTITIMLSLSQSAWTCTWTMEYACLKL